MKSMPNSFPNPPRPGALSKLPGFRAMSRLRSRPLRSSSRYRWIFSMRALLRHTGLFTLLCFISIPSAAQLRRTTPAETPVLIIRPLVTPASPSFSMLQDSTMSLRPSRSPALATVFSALVPGSGQIYAERYWTLPLIWGFGYWFVRQYISTDRKYVEWRAKYSETLTSSISGDAYAKYVRDFYRDQRDSFAFYLALTYVLNIVDAYVGASLYNFDVSEDLGGTANIRFELRVPLQ